MHQEIQYCTTSDGVRLAYSIISKDTPIVRTPHWFAHLQYDLERPIFRHQILGLAHQDCCGPISPRRGRDFLSPALSLASPVRVSRISRAGAG
jgi:hypothetical protein